MKLKIIYHDKKCKIHLIASQGINLMSFMVLNTGRVASQYFYLNLKLQSSILIPSRYEFDYVAKSYIKRKYKGPFNQFEKWQKENLAQNSNLTTGIVFHSVRRNLVYPLNSQRNLSFLKELRDKIGLKTIFFPLRDPKEVFLSELNRQLARGVGDWAFPNGLNDWRKNWKMSDWNLVKDQKLPNHNLSSFISTTIDETNLKKASKNFIMQTGKIFSLFDLFSTVFDQVKIFDYKDLIANSESVFEKMANHAEFKLSNRSLFKTRLNGLANRFMLYNTFNISVDRYTQRKWNKSGIDLGEGGRLKFKLGSIHRATIGKHNPLNRSCRFKIEIPAVFPVCEDWGKFEQVSIIPKPFFETVKKIIGSEIAIGVHADDFSNFSQAEMREMIQFIYRTVIPRFETNFKIMYNYYRETVYYKEIPSTNFYKKFWEECEHEYNKIKVVMSNPTNLL